MAKKAQLCDYWLTRANNIQGISKFLWKEHGFENETDVGFSSALASISKSFDLLFYFHIFEYR